MTLRVQAWDDDERLVCGFDGTVSLSSTDTEATLADGAPVTGMQYDGTQGTDADAYHPRVVQEDGGLAWAGPLWATPTRGG